MYHSTDGGLLRQRFRSHVSVGSAILYVHCDGESHGCWVYLLLMYELLQGLGL